jgi:uncharacterized protein (DUF2249 family)
LDEGRWPGSLRAGEGFVLVNEHDPKPLYYRFAAEHAGRSVGTTWRRAPQIWRVRIGRTSPDGGD